MESKKILLAVTGSIAAYKSAALIRLLIKAGHEVKVIMTQAATKFISPLTLATLSGHEVFSEVTDGAAWNNHVELGLWADAMIVAPATASTLGKMAHGISDNFVTAVYLSAKCPVYFAPAMDRDMSLHPATLDNIERLQSFGNILIDSEYGELASGLIGKGRMAEPEHILSFLESDLAAQQDLTGKKVMITAGPTYERIDPVRFIGNHSTGKMGIAIATECISRGAEVHLVLGPSQQSTAHLPSLQVHKVTTGNEMLDACNTLHGNMDICIFSAAVSDYRPIEVAKEKIKKASDSLEIHLTKTTDIAHTLGQKKRPDQLHVGFALETNNEATYAKGKLEKKNFDMIVLNSLKDKGAGFAVDTNKVTLFLKDGSSQAFPLKTKREVATDIINTLIDNYVITDVN